MSRVKEQFEQWQQEQHEQEQRELDTLYADKRWDEVIKALSERGLKAVPQSYKVIAT